MPHTSSSGLIFAPTIFHGFCLFPRNLIYTKYQEKYPKNDNGWQKVNSNDVSKQKCHFSGIFQISGIANLQHLIFFSFVNDLLMVFFCLGFLSQIFTIHRALPPASLPPRYLDISRAITAESSPLHIASSRARTGKLWFSNANCKPLGYSPVNNFKEK